ncbi:MAG: DUF3990 domain-containing protein [Kiritimatiellae bacterium]|nr:DUF3990 domain-containing protein [Kiritimatiellia bacterium]
MKLYHGSNIELATPKLIQGTRALDFGQAVYLTSDFDQASRWAKTSVLRRKEGRAIVSVYEFDESAASQLRILNFPGPDAAWLKYVSQNRNGIIDTVDYDIVSGPVANDNTMPVLNLYFKGAYSEDEALRRLLPQRLRDQFAMKTDAALACIKFIEGSVV